MSGAASARSGAAAAIRASRSRALWRTSAPRRETPRLRAHRGERGHAVEVHEDGRAREAHVHHGHQALAARQRLGVGPVAGEELQRLVDRARGEVLERGRSHAG